MEEVLVKHLQCAATHAGHWGLGVSGAENLPSKGSTSL